MDWLALIKQAKEQPKIHVPLSSEKDEFSDLSDMNNESTRTIETLTRRTLQTPHGYCGSAVRGIIGNPYKMDLKTIKKTPDISYFDFDSKAVNPTAKCKTKLRSSSKTARNPYDFNNKAYCPTPKKEILSSSNFNSSLATSKSADSTERSSCSFLRQMKKDHGFSRNNKGFSEEDKNSQAKCNPRIVITSEDGDRKSTGGKSRTSNEYLEVGYTFRLYSYTCLR